MRNNFPKIDIPDDAGKFREQFVDFYRQFEGNLQPDTSARLTLFVGVREISMSLSRISSDKIGFVYFIGRDDENNPIDVAMHFAAIVYSLEGVPTDKPRRVGFGVDAGQRITPNDDASGSSEVQGRT